MWFVWQTNAEEKNKLKSKQANETLDQFKAINRR